MATQKAEYIQGFRERFSNSQMGGWGFTADNCLGTGKALLLTLSVAVTKP